MERGQAKTQWCGLLVAGVGAMAGMLTAPGPARAQADAACATPICWRIENRFRLFRDKSVFQHHEDAWRATAAENHSVLAMERWLNSRPGSPAAGWAERAVRQLCFDDVKNVTEAFCRRDGVRENYINPKTFAVSLTAALPDGFADATCEWSAQPVFVNGDEKPAGKISGCKAAPARVRGGATKVTVTMRASDGSTRQETDTIKPANILVAGIGDSFTSGEGNPDIPVALKSVGDQGACFRRLIDGSRFFLPARDVDTLNRDCDAEQTDYSIPEWTKPRAQWLHAPCHRSLYGYQMRSALTLALENPHRTVTYIPLGCTGAEIEEGLFKAQKSRERMVRDNRTAPVYTGGQLANLRTQIKAAPKPPDLLFLSIGGNDAGFSSLVANIIVSAESERGILKSAGYLFGPEEARKRIPALVKNFARLRKSLKPMLGGALSNVVYLPYGNPLKHGADHDDCGNTRRGFDGHPAFAYQAAPAKQVSDFVDTELIPLIKSLALCTNGKCADPSTETMKFAAAHRPHFLEHGVCAAAAGGGGHAEPVFDVDCFGDGNTFRVPADVATGGNGLEQPFRLCARGMSEWRPYASRQRWTRTPNDSYLTAMTYADSLPAIIKGRFITDAAWGLSTMVFGGAAHPTAEGHAAMADSALEQARAILSAHP